MAGARSQLGTVTPAPGPGETLTDGSLSLYGYVVTQGSGFIVIGLTLKGLDFVLLIIKRLAHLRDVLICKIKLDWLVNKINNRFKVVWFSVDGKLLNLPLDCEVANFIQILEFWTIMLNSSLFKEKVRCLIQLRLNLR